MTGAKADVVQGAGASESRADRIDVLHPVEPFRGAVDCSESFRHERPVPPNRECNVDVGLPSFRRSAEDVARLSRRFVATRSSGCPSPIRRPRGNGTVRQRAEPWFRSAPPLNSADNRDRDIPTECRLRPLELGREHRNAADRRRPRRDSGVRPSVCGMESRVAGDGRARGTRRDRRRAVPRSARPTAAAT